MIGDWKGRAETISQVVWENPVLQFEVKTSKQAKKGITHLSCSNFWKYIEMTKQGILSFGNNSLEI